MDFLIYQQNAGGSGTASTGDANGDGLVNNADLVIWDNQYGTSPSLAAATSAVPEPASSVLLAFVGIALSTLRTRRFL